MHYASVPMSVAIHSSLERKVRGILVPHTTHIPCTPLLDHGIPQIAIYRKNRAIRTPYKTFADGSRCTLVPGNGCNSLRLALPVLSIPVIIRSNSAQELTCSTTLCESLVGKAILRRCF